MSSSTMQTTYQAFYTPRRSRLNRTLGRARNTSSTDRYNDPDTNYDDPARPPPPFVSRLQPLSFTSSMAPAHVAECPVPFAYPLAATAAATGSSSNQYISPEFSTTSLASRHAAERAQLDSQRYGISGAEAFRFALRSDAGSFTTHPHIRPGARRTVVPVVAPPPKPISRLHPSVTSKLPNSAFYYHVNHTRSMVAENQRRRNFRSPNNPTVIITANVYPRAPNRQQEQQQSYSARSHPGATSTLFPYSQVPGMASTARPHAFDTKAPRVGPIMYDSFPLHQQSQFQLNPQAIPERLNQTTNRFEPTQTVEEIVAF